MKFRYLIAFLLSRWCVLAPLYIEEPDLLYSKLHLAMLEGLLEAEVFCPSPTQRNVISAQHVTTLVKICNNKIERILQKYVLLLVVLN